MVLAGEKTLILVAGQSGGRVQEQSMKARLGWTDRMQGARSASLLRGDRPEAPSLRTEPAQRSGERPRHRLMRSALSLLAVLLVTATVASALIGDDGVLDDAENDLDGAMVGDDGLGDLVVKDGSDGSDDEPGDDQETSGDDDAAGSDADSADDDADDSDATDGDADSADDGADDADATDSDEGTGGSGAGPGQNGDTTGIDDQDADEGSDGLSDDGSVDATEEQDQDGTAEQDAAGVNQTSDQESPGAAAFLGILLVMGYVWVRRRK